MDALNRELIRPNLLGVHRCPTCGARHAERRTPKSYFERVDVKITGRRPYRCLSCGRRFSDHPYHRPHAPEREETATPVAEMVSVAVAPNGNGHAEAETIVRRRRRWVVDPGNTPLGPSEVYGLVLVVSILLVLAVVVARAFWSGAPVGPRVID